jgi:hypothetical protein
MLVDIKRDPDFLKAYNAVIVKDQNQLINDITRKATNVRTVIRQPAEILFIDPVFVLSSGQDNEPYKPSRRKHRGTRWMESGIRHCSKALNYRLERLDPYDRANSTAYMDYSRHREMVREMLQAVKNEMVAFSITNIPKESGEKEQMPLAVFYQEAEREMAVSLDNFLFTILSIPMYPLLPVSAVSFAMPTYRYSLYYYLMDPKTGRMVYAESETFDEKFRDDYMKSFLYNSMLQGKQVQYEKK